LRRHWSTESAYQPWARGRRSKLDGILRNHRANGESPVAEPVGRNDAWQSFSIDVASPGIEPFAIDPAVGDDLLGALIVSNETDWNLELPGSLADVAATSKEEAIQGHAGTHTPAQQPVARNAAETPSGRDRRAHPRHESGCIVAVLPQSNRTPASRDRIEWLLRSTQLRGQLVDVSMTGLAMRLSEPLECHSRIELRITNPRFNQHVDCSAKVLRCQKAGDGHWQIVCRFERSLTFPQLHRIGRHLFASTIV
jgi:hypothetical protein